MSYNRMIQNWPEELILLTEGMFTPAQMPSVYFEYLLAKAAMADMGLASVKTDPSVFIHIKEMYTDIDGNFGIIKYEGDDA